MRTEIPETASLREKLLFLLRAAVFCILLFLLLRYALYVLVPKHDYGICSMTNLYQQQEDQIDVLVLGTSLAYAGVNTHVLWSEYGIAAYDLCGAEQPYWASFHYLEEALKTQRPRLIVLDAKASTYSEDYSGRGRTFLCSMGIRDLGSRLAAIRSCVSDEEFMGYALGFPELHSFYHEVTWDSFAYPPDNGGRGSSWKGYIEQAATEPASRPSLVRVETKKPVNAREEAYLRRIIALTQREGIPLLLVGFPNPAYADDHLYYNSVWAIAEECGVPYINYNAPGLRYGLTYASCFADQQHLNVKGSVIFSRKLGEDLRTLFELPDRRADAAYRSWEGCAEQWYGQYPEYRPEHGEGDRQ